MKPITISLFEHQFRSYEEIQLPSDHLVFEHLDQINNQAGKEIITLGRKGIKANEMVGVIRIDQITFQILPKIDYKLNQGNGRLEKENTAVLNLFFLLSYAFDLKLYQPDLAQLASRHANWYEFLTYLFATDLHRQIQLGFVQNYIHCDDTLPMIRGRWDLNRQIGQHAFVKDRFDVHYDEFSPHILLNRVFYFVVEHLRQTTLDERNLALLTDLSTWLSPVTLLAEIPLSLLDQVHFNRLNERFLPAFQLARLFLSQQTISLQSDRFTSFAFVLDMNLLFERFVARFLESHRQEILPESWQNIQIIPQSQGKNNYMAHRTSSGKPIVQLKPDLLFRRPGFLGSQLVIDTKYKQLDPSMRRLGVMEGDLYQMLAYITRFECPQTVLLYPQPEAQTSVHELFLLEPSKSHVWIHTINLHQPLEDPKPLIQEFQNIFSSLFNLFVA